MSDFDLRRVTACGGNTQTSIITIVGEIDLSAGPALREALTQSFSETGRIVVDAREVTFLDITGLLIGAAHRAARDGRVFIVMPSSPARYVFALVDADLDFVLPLDSAEGAQLSIMCREAHHEDCISGCACPCHP